MENEMIERVARALCSIDMEEMLRSGMAADKGSPVQLAFAAVGAVDELWPNYVERARATIEAMREPSETMTDGALAAGLDIYWGYEATGPGGPEDVWRAMIDAALKAQPSHPRERAGVSNPC